jgi:hypothetical protein
VVLPLGLVILVIGAVPSVVFKLWPSDPSVVDVVVLISAYWLMLRLAYLGVEKYRLSRASTDSPRTHHG